VGIAAGFVADAVFFSGALYPWIATLRIVHLACGRTIRKVARPAIAAQCGTAPEVLSRTFRRLEDDGVVAADIDHVTVLRPDRLRALAEWTED
jgi:hypothetical protein